jgi:beta-lactamase regulating signal transducer with metallopeptidase domain
MSDIINLFAERIVSYLAVGSVTAVVLAPLAWAVIRTGKLRAAIYRQLLWLYCLIGIAVLPVVWLYGPKLTLAVLPAKTVPPVAESAPAIDVGYEPEPIEEILTEIDQPEVQLQTVVSPKVRRIDAKVVIVVVWLVGTLLMLARLAVGWYRLGRICCSAMPVQMDKRFGDLVQRKLQILVSSGVNGPVCFGLLRPTIILPRRTYENSSSEELRMVLNHELAHIERRDCWTNLLQRIVEAVFFFHPLVWWVSFQLTQEREFLPSSGLVGQLSAYAGARTDLRQLRRRPGSFGGRLHRPAGPDSRARLCQKTARHGRIA